MSDFAAAWRSGPKGQWTNGDLAAKVMADLGLPPDDEQRALLDAIYAEKAPNRPAAFEVCVIGPRQNIKTSTLGGAALADLFVFGVQKHLWSAHLDDTAKGTFQDFKAWIESNPEYAEQVDFYEGHQDRSIVHIESGRRIDFGSRTGKGKRGLTGVERVTLDEALYLEPKHMGAVYPTMLTRPGAQVRLGSSAGLLMSASLRTIRERGRSKKDPRLAYVEYAAEARECASATCNHLVVDGRGPDGCALDDRELWWQANCALWSGRVEEDALLDQRVSLPPEEFAREFLSWWDDPESLGGAISAEAWKDLKDPDAPRGERVAFGVDVAEDRTSWIAVAWWRPDESAHVVLVENDPMAAHRLAQRAEEVAVTWGGPVVGPKSLEAELLRAGCPWVIAATSGEFGEGCAEIANRVTAGTIHHGNQSALNRAVAAARWRGPAGARQFQMAGMPEVGPLAAAARAIHGLVSTPPPATPTGGTDSPSRGHDLAGETAGLSTMGF